MLGFATSVDSVPIVRFQIIHFVLCSAVAAEHARREARTQAHVTMNVCLLLQLVTIVKEDPATITVFAADAGYSDATPLPDAPTHTGKHLLSLSEAAAIITVCTQRHL